MSSVLIALAQRLNVGSPKLLRPRTSRNTSSPGPTTSEDHTGDLPRSFEECAERFAFIVRRRTDPDSIREDTASPRTSNGDVFDPFAPRAPSIFYSDEGNPSFEPYTSSPPKISVTGRADTRARCPLNDLSAYFYGPNVDKSSKPPKSRLHIWASGLDLPSPTTSTDADSFGKGNSKNGKPGLRPLILPSHVARREIAEAQHESIVSPTSLKFRPLVLPQRLAYRRGRPSRPRSHRHLHPTGVSAFGSIVTDGSKIVNGRPMINSLRAQASGSSSDNDKSPSASELGSEHARRVSRRHVSEPCLRRDDGDGNVVAAPQHAVSSQLPKSVQPQAISSPQRHQHAQGEGAYLFGQGPVQLPQDKQEALREAPLGKPLPEVRQDRSKLKGLISLLHQDGVIAGTTLSLDALAVASGAGLGSGESCDAQASCSSAPPVLRMKGSTSTDLRRSLLEAMNDTCASSPSMWSIATTHAESVVWAYAL
ncbi:hypothetical protein BD311DRAFT_652144 [Dichomitus squalens]|uniref:Uncharacterized protein n=1 Tax=Dichomitus squalens TaxID=114155 RepID=A0A4Q9MZF5_9APHY|nr:hypothetical protein BD311DRAFT_652144 [Dichomitus squalens]